MEGRKEGKKEKEEREEKEEENEGDRKRNVKAKEKDVNKVDLFISCRSEFRFKQSFHN